MDRFRAFTAWLCALAASAALLLTLASPSPAVTCSSIQDQLTPNKAAVQINCLPSGTDHIGVAVMKTLAGEGLKEGINVPASTTVYTPPAGYTVVGLSARSASGSIVGSWASRIQIVPGGTSTELEAAEHQLATDKAKVSTLEAELASARSSVTADEAKVISLREVPVEQPPIVEPPREEPAPSTFRKGIDAGGWGSSAEVPDILKLGPNPSVRLENPGNTSAYTQAGIHVTYLLNHYNTGGIKSVNVSSYVAEAEAEAARNPTDTLEVENEPGGNWFWGSGAESSENAAAYDRLLKAVHEHVHVPIDASFDGGHAGNNAWGRAMLAADPNVVNYVTAFTEHPYDGSSANPASTLDRWGAVEEAHRLTGKPIDITEYGRPLESSTGDSPKSTEAQQAAADGAMVHKAHEVGWVPEVDIFGYRGGNYGVFASNDTPHPAVAAIAAG